jgi:hypothetical protein
MKKLMILVTFIFSFNALSAGMPSEWYFGSDNKENTETKSNYDLDESMDSLHQAQTYALEKAEGEKSSWYLDHMKTILGLTLKGKLGIKSWGGKKGIELIWKKRSASKNLEEVDSEKNTFDLSEFKSSENAMQGIEPFINSLVESGKVKNADNLRAQLSQKVQTFFEVAKGAEAAAVQAYRPHKIRLDLSISADGSVNGLFVKVGGDVRIRLEWSRKTFYQKSNKDLGSVAQKTQSLLNGLASEIAKSIEEEPAAKSLKLKEFKVGIGVSVSGNVGVAKASASVVPQVYFKKVTLVEKVEEIHVTEIPFLTDDKSNEVKMISSNRVRKGFKKSLRFAEYFQKKFSKKKYKESTWAVHTIKPSFTFDLSGDVGVVTLKGIAVFELAYLNNNF